MSKQDVFRLGDVVESMKNGIYKPASAYADDGIACLRMYNIDQGKIVWRDVKRMLLTQQDLDEYGLHSGDLLVNRVNSRELVGKSAIIPEWQEPVVFESKNIRVRLDKKRALPKFVNYQLFLSGSRYFANNAQQVVGMASINQKQLADFPIVLPSLHRQEEVVAEIEKQFSRLDEAVSALKRIHANLKRYKAAVLKAAVEGKLTEKWRKEHPDVDPADQLLKRILTERRTKWEAEELEKMNAKGRVGAHCMRPNDSWKKKYKEPAGPDTANLPELPEGWVWATVEQLGNVFGGLTKNPKRATMPLQLPYLRVANIYANKLRLDEIEHIGIEERERAKLLVLTGDLLIVEGNGSPEQIGRVAIWDGSIEPCVHQNHLIKVRLPQECLPKWTLYWLLSANGRNYIREVSNSTSGLYTLSVGKVGGLPVPLPSLTEQQQIIAEIDRRLSVTEELETTIETNLKRAERLRQTILQRAFGCKSV